MISEEKRERLRRAVCDLTERYRTAGYFPSACVRVFDAEGTLAAVCAGDAREDSLFDAASLTKIATATQALRLISAGKLELQAPLEALFPEIAGNAYLRERLAGITLRHLLTHTSTIADWYPFYSRRGEDFWTVLEYALRHTEPVSGMVYSDINFMLIHPSALIQFQKHVAPKVVTPEQNPDADAWKFGYRTVGIADVYENKLAGIYCHAKA